MAKQLKSIKFPGLDDVYVIPEGGAGAVDIDLLGSAEGGVKPQSPLKHTESGDYFYPLTTMDQVISDDGSRLTSYNFLTVEADPYEIIEGEATPINADTLGGHKAEDFVKKDDAMVVTKNYCVVGGMEEPENPTENMIWVQTEDTEIGNVYFSGIEPSSVADNDIWILTDTNSSTAAFDSIRIGNDTMQTIYPISAKQYIGGAWVDKTTKSWQNGKWVDWIPAGALYWDGIDRTNFTGGWESLAVNIIDTVSSKKALTVENYNGYVKIYQTNGGARGLYVTKNKIRINGYSSLKLSGEIYSLNGNPIVVALMTDKTKNGVIASYSFAQHGITKTFDDESIITLPSSGGEYYVGIGIASSDDKYIQIKNLYFE